MGDNSLIFKDDDDRFLELKQKYNLNGENIILYYGTFEPYQGIDLLIESGLQVIKRFQNVRFVLIGGYPHQIEYYLNEVKKQQVDKFFIFAGMVRPHEIPGFVKNAKILVSPRKKGNNSPLKIYSYLRSGKPIIATRHVTHTQILNDEVAVLTECNPKDFAEGICKVLEDDQLQTQLAANARKLAEEQYGYNDYLKKIGAILKMTSDNYQRGML